MSDEFPPLRPREQILRDAAVAAHAEIEQLRAERQAVLHCINLYGDETLHKALDAIGFVPREKAS